MAAWSMAAWQAWTRPGQARRGARVCQWREAQRGSGDQVRCVRVIDGEDARSGLA